MMQADRERKISNSEDLSNGLTHKIDMMKDL
jgi:hypothetical protein